MKSQKPQLIVALDVSTLEEARVLIDTLSPVVDIFKVGSQLFTACGPAAVRFVLARGKKVFLDLKYHDIPNTVGHAVEAAVGLSSSVHQALDAQGIAQPREKHSIFMCTVHVTGGKEMLERAVEAACSRAKKQGVAEPLVVGITVLTSEKKEDSIQNLVLERARLAKEAGLQGVVASVEEAALIRRECGPDFVIVTPGIRPLRFSKNDQKRIATPKDAIANGSNFLVVGRPIIQSDDPLQSAKMIVAEMR